MTLPPFIRVVMAGSKEYKYICPGPSKRLMYAYNAMISLMTSLFEHGVLLFIQVGNHKQLFVFFPR